ncbi:hypothetical protein TNCV_365591 [Trichonephila clavipes]|nr:hypothetical protein TNCV_365591 [Trichonephila clavipes]
MALHQGQDNIEASKFQWRKERLDIFNNCNNQKGTGFEIALHLQQYKGYCAGLSIGGRHSDKLDLTRFPGYKSSSSSSAKGARRSSEPWALNELKLALITLVPY